MLYEATQRPEAVNVHQSFPKTIFIGNDNLHLDKFRKLHIALVTLNLFFDLDSVYYTKGTEYQRVSEVSTEVGTETKSS